MPLKIYSLAVSIFITFFLSNCTTTSLQSGGTALVKGGGANFTQYLTGKGGQVFLLEINGKKIPPNLWTGSVRSLKVTPGLHNITISISGNNNMDGLGTVQIQANAGHSYKIEVSIAHGINFDVKVYDEGISQIERKEIFSTKINGVRSAVRLEFPVMIL